MKTNCYVLEIYLKLRGTSFHTLEATAFDKQSWVYLDLRRYTGSNLVINQQHFISSLNENFEPLYSPIQLELSYNHATMLPHFFLILYPKIQQETHIIELQIKESSTTNNQLILPFYTWQLNESKAREWT